MQSKIPKLYDLFLMKIVGDKFDISIRSLGTHGEGVGDLDGFTLFVDGALPGERVFVELTAVKKTYGVGKLLRILERSPDRVDPVCPLFGRCGGCQVMHLNYSSQLERKRQRVVDAFERIGKLMDVEVLPCVPSPLPLKYRNKVQAPIRQKKEGLSIGFYARNSHHLVDVDLCYIHCALGQRVYERSVALLKSSGISKEKLRHLIIKTAVKTEQALVVIVTGTDQKKSLARLAEEIQRQCPEVKGVIQNVNPHLHNVVLGKTFEVLSGQGWMEEEILDLRFYVSPASFFQVNPAQAEQLYRQVIDWAELKGGERVLDAYCGVGTLSLLLARKAGRVVGVECVPQAIADAERNASLNCLANVSFVCAEAEKWIQSAERMDLVVLNPPRKGCHPEMIKAIGKMRPTRLIYVSCDPATLARDLAMLQESGYKIDGACPFDMFPQTAHVETVVKLSTKL
ncbi:23S rRNA (uracil(1939)-C(5))-methyltransferase RlmD [Waddlia chondrophila]|uniref:23S rRNA (uracil(1939)-C(5))-methyltransferase RlmD n=1 Tax=Waddlia chondrophila TaxID=71667 RepID=UPI000A8A9BFF|nr:23S rRNA (uracil(1939)-C(5))-methyltransferase RlmD [Waddlia chondrophila]